MAESQGQSSREMTTMRERTKGTLKAPHVGVHKTSKTLDLEGKIKLKIHPKK